jgi:hypothetical protein
MSLRLQPPVAMWKDLRQLTRWCAEALLTGTVGTDNLDALSVTTTKIAANAVTLPKLATVAADTLLGRSTAGTGDVETITCTAAGRALLDDAAASNQRTTLGLGTSAVVNTGTSGATVPLLDGANTHASVQATLFAVGAVTPITTQAANPDTSGAVLADLETEVNQIKTTLRAFGLIAP